jgi:cyanophycin synthetase
MASHCTGEVIYFAPVPENPTLLSHRSVGGRGVFVRSGWVILARGEREEQLTPLTQVPLTHGGRVGFQVENVLAATAAAWALGLPADLIRTGLASFPGNATQVPGRFNVLQEGSVTVIVDYAHNPSALAAIVQAIEQFPHQRRTLVFTACNRRDADVMAMGTLIGEGFDRIVLYRDHGNNERRDGELNGLLRRGWQGARRLTASEEVEGEHKAIERALSGLQPGDLVVVGVESIEESLAHVAGWLSRHQGSPGKGLPAT